MAAEDARSGPPPGLEPLTASDPTYIGRYRVAGRLGAGGMGAVYAALDDHDRCLAVKVVHREYAADTDFRARFAREVGLVSKITAACTARFVDADTDAERPWLATEYVPGPTLRARVREQGPLSGGMLVGLAAGVAEALHVIHAAGVVHRDLKPGNLILAPDGPKVLDFGIARAVDESGITRTGGLVGSPGWVAPERYEGQDATPLSDVFSWGGLVALAASGRNPFGTGGANVVAYRTLRESPDVDGVPGALLPLVERALSRDPLQRPATSELLRSLAALSEATAVSPEGEEPTRMVTRMLRDEWRGVTSPGHDPTSWTALAPPPRRRRKPAIAAVGAAAVLLAAGGVYAWQAAPWEGPGEDSANASGDPSGQSPQQGEGSGQGTGGGAGPEASESDPPEPLFGPEAGAAAAAPGVFEYESEGQPQYEITLRSVSESDSGLEFGATADYLGGTGDFTLDSTDFYIPDRSAVGAGAPDAADVPEAARAYPDTETPLAELSADQPQEDFTFTIPGSADPGAIVFDAGGDDNHPHLCYRTDRIYEQSDTNFLNNHWRAWDMCTDGDSTYD